MNTNTPNEPSYRPNPKRQALYAAVALAAVFGGYFAATYYHELQQEKAAAARPAEKPREPWYKTQAPPPAMVTAPDAPLFPDTDPAEGEGPHLAYEEALPEEVYVAGPPKVSLPVPEPLPEPEAPAPAVEQPPPPPPPAPPEELEYRLGRDEPAPSRMAGTTGGVPRSFALPPLPDNPPWRLFDDEIPDPQGSPIIALVIDDMGIDRARSARIAALQGPLTVSYLTYARDLATQANAARAAGHEVLLHVPMEPISEKLDPGPGVLLTSHAPDELRRRLGAALGRYDSFIGINNHMGSKFTADELGMMVVMEELRRRGLLFLDSRTSGRSVGAALARNFGVPVAERNVFLDHVNDPAAVTARLNETARLARTQGWAVAIGHPRDATLKALEKWLPEARAAGYVFAPLSAVVDFSPALAQAQP